MKLSDWEAVKGLRSERDEAIALRKAAQSGPIDCEVWYGGEKFDPFLVIDTEPVRVAILSACDVLLSENATVLQTYGVTDATES